MTDYALSDTIYKMFTTRAFGTGIPTVLAGSPVVSVYENDNLTEITTGVVLTVDHDGVVGLNRVVITATGGNGFEVDKDYNLVITTGTVASVSVVGEVVGSFSINRSASKAGSIVAGTFGAGAIDAAAIAANAIGASELATDAIGAAQIGADAITAAKIADDAIAAEHLATGAIVAATFAAGAIDAAAIATDAIGAPEFAQAAADKIWATATRTLTSSGDNPTLMQSTTITGLVSQTVFNLVAGSADNDAYNGALVVLTDVSTSTQKAIGVVSDYLGSAKTVTLVTAPIFTIANTDNIDIIAAVGASDVTLADGSFTAAKWAASAIDASAIAANAITAGKIATGAITAAKFAADAITSTVVADNFITAAKINADAITAAKVAAGTIDAATFAAGAINAAAIATDAGAKIRGSTTGTADSGSTTTLVDNALTEANDYWKGARVRFTGGTLAGQSRIITGFVAASDTITFSPAVTTAVVTHAYEIEFDTDPWVRVLGNTTWSASAIAQITVAVNSGKISGLATTTSTLRDSEDAANLVVATVDADGNRSAVTVTPPAD